ncbi:MAG: hypothetical protein JW860_11030 [Sedimentisphaerales bacterium]|nr:hypothetical protein [Sedimentisphaerales bacterium]
MKNVSGIILLMALVSVVNATVILSPEGTVEVVEGDSLVFYVESDTSSSYECVLCYYDAPVTPPGSPLPAAGQDATIYCEEGCCELAAMDFNPDPPNIEPGFHFEFTLTTSPGDAGNSYDIDLYASDWMTVLDTLAVEVIEAECFDSSHPDYAEWLSVGNPECWCLNTQCEGNADGFINGSSKSGYYHVGPGDLELLTDAWLIWEPPQGPGVASVPNGICADFARDLYCTKSGCTRVFASDLSILLANWIVPEPPFGPGVPTTGCGGDIEAQYAVISPPISFSTDSVDILPGEQAGIGIVANTYDSYIAYVGSDAAVDGGGNTSFTVAIEPAAGVDAYADWYPGGYVGYYALYAWEIYPGETDLVPGTHFIVTAGDADLSYGQSYEINLYADDWETILDTVTVNIADCFDSGHPDYDYWVAAGRPDCFCYTHQCQGDADGQLHGNEKTGYYRVGAPDLTLLINGWRVLEPTKGPGLIGTPEICADFARDLQGGTKTGYYRVGSNDLTILLTNWRVTEPTKGPGLPPGTCGGDL